MRQRPGSCTFVFSELTVETFSVSGYLTFTFDDADDVSVEVDNN